MGFVYLWMEIRCCGLEVRALAAQRGIEDGGSVHFSLFAICFCTRVMRGFAS